MDKGTLSNVVKEAWGMQDIETEGNNTHGIRIQLYQQNICSSLDGEYGKEGRCYFHGPIQGAHGAQCNRSKDKKYVLEPEI